jgi:hypothetical protein
MKDPLLILCLCSLLMVAALLGAGCTSAPAGGTTPAPTVTTPVLPPSTIATPGQSSCGLTTCHGLDLACGTNAPQVCTEEYKLGDRCRNYARCDTGSGSCTLVTAPQFVTCRACAERCEIGAGPDALAAFACEEKC